MIPKRFFIPFILIAIPVFLGLLARYQAVPYWEQHKKEFFVEGRPIFTAYDSYLFARYAEDYKKGIFKPGEDDKLRFVPDYVKYPDVIPFYSWLFAKLSQIFKKPVENLSFWLVPILATLFVIPLVLLLYFENLSFAAFSGATLGVISLIYTIRTSINRLDTDSIILFSLFSIPLAVYLFEKSKSLKGKYFSLLLLAIFSNLFYWGYLHPGLNLVLWIFSIFFITFYPIKDRIFKRKTLNEKKIWHKLLLITLAFNPLILLEGISNLFEKIYSYIFHFGKPIGGFPNISVSISELQILDWKRISLLTAGNEFLLLLGFIGISIFFILKFRYFLLIAPILLMGLISLKGASRFSMFLAPILGTGIGFLIDLLWKNLKDRISQKVEFGASILTMLLLSFIFAYANKESFRFKPRPIMNSDIASAFIELGKRTPPDAWIFTWWDYGYAIQYYARRATFHDGGIQFPPKTYFIALAFSSYNPQIGYNITKTLEICGAKCIKNFLKEGKTPEQIRDLFVKGKLLEKEKTKNPIYWVFTEDLIGKFYWISYFGFWDFKTLKGKHKPIFQAVCKKANNNIQCYGGGIPFIFNPQRLMMLIKGKFVVPVKYFALRIPNKLVIKKNTEYPYGNCLEAVYTYIPNIYQWYLTDVDGFKTNFNQLYILRNPSENYMKYFKKVKEKFPDYVFYLVN